MKTNLIFFILISFMLINTCSAQEDSVKTSDSQPKDFFYYINSEPYNASVTYKDSLLGFTPLRFYSQNKLSGYLIFKKPEFKNYKLNLDDYNTENGISVRLEQINKFSLVEKERVSQFKSERNYKIIVGSGVLTFLSAYAAIYYKNIANNSYDTYQFSLNQSDLDKSKRYDIYSGLSLAVMQFAFAGLIYFLFLK